MIEDLRSNKELWDIFTKKEEYEPILLDKFKRFTYSSSGQRTVFEPIVSSYLAQNGLTVEYPDKKKFGVFLSHDIDILYSPFLKIAHEVKINLPSPRIKISPLWNFKKIMDIERKFNAKSTFFFMSLSKNDTDFNYNVDGMKTWLGRISDSGWEVGLHGGHKAFNDLNAMKVQKQRLEKVLGQKIIGYRNHLMKFQTPRTWELLTKAGFGYDSTFGYNDCVGFRNGMCHPFKPYNRNTNSEIGIWELPLHVMDSTFDNYMRLSNEDEWEITKQLIDSVSQINGVFTVLWHNTNMSGDRFKFYEKILKYCHGKGAWMTSGEEIITWWNKQGYKI